MGATERRVVLAAGFVLVAFLIWKWRGDSRLDLDSPAVLARVQQLNQLATVRYTIQKVVGLRDQKVPVGSESILLIMQANVEAGIDLASMHAGDVTVQKDGAVVMHLPEPKLLNVIIDEKETKVWDRQKTWWTPWVPYSLDLEQRARLAGLDAVKQTAVDMGILGQAQRNAQSSIKALLSLTGIRVTSFR